MIVGVNLIWAVLTVGIVALVLTQRRRERLRVFDIIDRTLQALNAPLGTVKSHVKRGADRLRAELAPSGGRDSQTSGSQSNG
jgi:hypothetical protein